MEILQNSFLEAPLKKLTDIYANEIVPKLTKKNKLIGISAAILMIVAYQINSKIRPPRNLRHIPRQGYFNFISSLLGNEPILKRAQRYALPLVNSNKNNGLYLRPGRLGWEVHTSNPEVIKRVLLKHDLFPKQTLPSNNKHSMVVKFIGSNNMVALSGGEHWKNQRKVANPAFHRSMPVKLFGKLTQQLFEEIEKMGPMVDVPDLTERWTLDAIGKAGFDFDFNALQNRDNDWVRIYNDVITGATDPLYFMFPFLEIYFLWMIPKRQRLHKELVQFKAMLRNVIAEKRKKVESGQAQNENLEDNEKDLLTMMLESEIQGEGKMTNDELENNLALFFVAGHDTTSNALASAICLLSLNPDIQQRARDESISILGDEPEDVFPTVEDTKNMEYINQIIKETLRMSGSVATVLPRVSVEDCELAGTFIPKGTRVSCNLFETMHSEKNWANPLKFDPDRFTPGGEASQQELKGMTWIPFGNGPRQCIGMNFSLAEQRVLLSMLLRKYTWELPKDSIHKDGLISSGLNIIGPKKLNVKFTKRY